MKPPAFDYLRANSVDEVIDLLREHGPDAKLLAGGQSLVPMLNFRLLRPSVVIDINRVPDLDRISLTGHEASVADSTAGALHLGTLVRHHTLESSLEVRRCNPLLAAAAAEIGHLAIRNRGTIGGSLAHNDPVGELPLIAVLLDANLHLRNPAGERSVPASQFFVSLLETDIGDEELLTGATFPEVRSDTGWGFEELSRRTGDFAIVAAAATLELDGGIVRQARIAIAGVGDVAQRFEQAEELLQGGALTREQLAAVRDSIEQSCTPTSDVHASADYRRHAAGVLTCRALEAAWSRTETGAPS